MKRAIKREDHKKPTVSYELPSKRVPYEFRLCLMLYKNFVLEKKKFVVKPLPKEPQERSITTKREKKNLLQNFICFGIMRVSTQTIERSR